MDRIAITFGIPDTAAGAGRLHVCEEGTGGLEDPVASAAAILDALVSLHVLDHVVGVCGGMTDRLGQ